MRPACVLLQAALGADMLGFHRFFGDSDKWLISMTPGMRMVGGTKEQWEEVVRMVGKTPKGKER